MQYAIREDWLAQVQEPVLDPEPVIEEWLTMGERIAPLVADTAGYLGDLRQQGGNLLFEGAQGTFLDVDHGTYPFVTSSNTVAGQAAAGSGLGPGSLNFVLGITKAYTTRVGEGPFPAELGATEVPGTHPMRSVRLSSRY